MVDLKHAEMRVLDSAFGMGSGYVLDFSDRTFAEFFDDEFSITIYQEKYAFNGSSKAKHLRAFITTENGLLVGRVLRRLWEYRETLPHMGKGSEHFDRHKENLFGLLPKIESGISAPRTDAIERFIPDETLDELVAAIERDIHAGKPVAALDRLHTYCQKKLAHLLETHGVAWDRSEPLHSRAGKYARAVEAKQTLTDLSRQIIKSGFGIFEKYNHVRNNDSLAHDNVLISNSEAHFIFDSIVTWLRFVKRIEAERFEQPGKRA